MPRPARLSPRQVVAVAGAAALGGAAVVTALAGVWRLAVAAVALLTLLAFAGVVVSRRALRRELDGLRVEVEHARVAAGQRSVELHREVLDRLDRLETGQRRILASLEAERLAAAEFRGELLARRAEPDRT